MLDRSLCGGDTDGDARLRGERERRLVVLERFLARTRLLEPAAEGEMCPQQAERMSDLRCKRERATVANKRGVDRTLLQVDVRDRDVRGRYEARKPELLAQRERAREAAPRRCKIPAVGGDTRKVALRVGGDRVVASLERVAVVRRCRRQITLLLVREPDVERRLGDPNGVARGPIRGHRPLERGARHREVDRSGPQFVGVVQHTLGIDRDGERVSRAGRTRRLLCLARLRDSLYIAGVGGEGLGPRQARELGEQLGGGNAISARVGERMRELGARRYELAAVVENTRRGDRGCRPPGSTAARDDEDQEESEHASILRRS